MVYTNLNRIQFGNGDVSVMVSMAGTRKEPQAMLVFQNREPAKIGRIDEDADLSRTKLGVYNPNKDIAMLFSKPESKMCIRDRFEMITEMPSSFAMKEETENE